MLAVELAADLAGIQAAKTDRCYDGTRCCSQSAFGSGFGVFEEERVEVGVAGTGDIEEPAVVAMLDAASCCCCMSWLPDTEACTGRHN